MAAPALVALAHGSRDPRSAASITALVAEVRALRPDLKVERAFLDLAKPSLDTTIDRLARKQDSIRAKLPATMSRTPATVTETGRRGGGAIGSSITRSQASYASPGRKPTLGLSLGRHDT